MGPIDASRSVLVSVLLVGVGVQAAPNPLLSDAYLQEHLNAPDAPSIVVAQVEDDVITLRELALALGYSHGGGHAKEGKVGKIDFAPVLNRIISARLIAAEARDMGMDTVPEFQKAVDEFKAAALQEVLKAQVTAGVVSDPLEVENAYKDSVREWKVRSVLITKKEDATAFAAAIKAGKPFDAQVKQLIAQKKGRGGEPAGFLPRSQLFAPVEQALQKLKQGELSPPVQVPGGWALVKYEDVRYPEDPKLRAAAEAQAIGRRKQEAMEKFYSGLVARYVKTDAALLKNLDFEAKEPTLEQLKKDTRVLAKIEGAEPITVQELATALEQSFFHGLDRAAAEKKANRQKYIAFDALISRRVVPLEVARAKVADSPEYKQRVQDYVNGALFNRFMELVIVPKLKLDEPAAKKYFEQHRKDYTYPAFYTLESLAFSDVKAAQAALTKLQAKTDFKWLNANADGQLKAEDRKLEISGTLSANGIPADLATLLSTAKKGDYRLYPGPENQFYVVHVVELTPSTVQPFEEARQAVYDKLFPDQLNLAIADWAAKLKKAHPPKLFVELK